MMSCWNVFGVWNGHNRDGCVLCVRLLSVERELTRMHRTYLPSNLISTGLWLLTLASVVNLCLAQPVKKTVSVSAAYADGVVTGGVVKTNGAVGTEIACGWDRGWYYAACSVDVDQNSSVKLTAKGTSSTFFERWGGHCFETAGATCTLSVSIDMRAQADFKKKPEVGVRLSGRGTVSGVGMGIACPSDCNEIYEPGTPVTLRATAGTDYVFERWASPDACAGKGATCTFVPLTGFLTFVEAVFRDPTIGQLQIAAVDSVTGWACNPASPNKTLTVDVTITRDSAVVVWTSGSAALSLPDNAIACGGSSRSGFVIPLNLSSFGHGNYLVNAKVRDSWTLSGSPRQVTIYETRWSSGDFNGDKKADLFLWQPVSGVNHLFLSDTFSGAYRRIDNAIPAAAISSSERHELALADFNGDGRSDAFFWWHNEGTNRLFLSDGAGAFSEKNNLIPPAFINGSEPHELAIGDFTGDKSADAFFFWPGDGRNRLCLWNGNGFTLKSDPITPAAINPFSSGSARLSIGDFTGDGKTDALFWWHNDGTNRFLRSNGDGTFTGQDNPMIPSAISGSEPHELAVGDFNGDKKGDAFFFWPRTGTNRLFHGSGTGFTQVPDPIPSAAINQFPTGAATLALGDFDGDGKSDAFFWWHNDGINRLFVSNGNGTFTGKEGLILPSTISGSAPHQLAFTDFTGDGKADALFWWSYENRFRYFTSDGSAFLASPMPPFVPSIPPVVTVGDLNVTAGVAVYQATNSLTATGVAISGSADVTFIAGSSVRLLPEFRATAGILPVTFRAATR